MRKSRLLIVSILAQVHSCGIAIRDQRFCDSRVADRMIGLEVLRIVLIH